MGLKGPFSRNISKFSHDFPKLFFQLLLLFFLCGTGAVYIFFTPDPRIVAGSGRPKYVKALHDRQTVRSIRLSTDNGIYHIETVGAYTFGFNDIVVSSNAERSFF